MVDNFFKNLNGTYLFSVAYRLGYKEYDYSQMMSKIFRSLKNWDEVLQHDKIGIFNLV